MSDFRDFLEMNDAMAASLAVQDNPTSAPVKVQKWKATKDEIISYWKSLRPDTPLFFNPIEYEHTGSTYGEDGIRITGRPEFIAAVLSRLKEVLNFETPQTKLSLTYRETESPSQSDAGINKTSYVFYVQARERGKGSIKAPKPKF